MKTKKNKKELEKMIAYDRKSGNSPQSDRISDKIDDLNHKNGKNCFRDNMHQMNIVPRFSVDMHECHEKIVCSHCTRSSKQMSTFAFIYGIAM